jgi:hypothetical protein
MTGRRAPPGTVENLFKRLESVSDRTDTHGRSVAENAPGNPLASEPGAEGSSETALGIARAVLAKKSRVPLLRVPPGEERRRHGDGEGESSVKRVPAPKRGTSSRLTGRRSKGEPRISPTSAPIMEETAPSRNGKRRVHTRRFFTSLDGTV